MRILAIDPGTYQSGWVVYDTEDHSIPFSGITPNEEVVETMDVESHLAIEMVGCYGMAVGKSVFETCVWIGQFIRAWNVGGNCKDTLEELAVYRRDVKLYLCNSVRAKDANVRQAILDKFKPYGGGKTPQVGTKKQPGPLYGIKSHMWAALGVALTFAARLKEEETQTGQ